MHLGYSHWEDALKVFSPFQTGLWLQCPIKRALVNEGWTTRDLEQRDVSALLGIAIAEGLARFNRGEPDGGGAAFAEAQRLQARHLDAGRKVPDWLASQWERVPGRAEAAVSAYAVLDPLPKTWRIVAVEEPYGPEGGNARPDLIVDDGRQARVPLDFKVSLSLGAKPAERERNRQRRVDRWSRAHQLMHYSWMEKADHYYIGHLILEPEFTFELLPFDIHPESFLRWQTGAWQVWEDMEAEDEGKRRPYMPDSHSDEYGPCPYLAACFDFHYDETLMATKYVKVERRS